jgi:DNA/RNA-binding domain of Phe-tRNA-synthetase-like protein
MIVTGVSNPTSVPALDERLATIENGLRERYAGLDRAALRATPPFDSYDRFYKTFGQNYHVQHQVESVALKNKPIPRRAALVEAAFAEELRSGLLTAMHDADAIGPAIVTDAASGTETVTLYNSKNVTLDEGDMFMRDDRGILTTVIRGPAVYGLVTSETVKVVVCVYAPAGIGVDPVRRHLQAIFENLRLISENATIEFLEVIEA